MGFLVPRKIWENMLQLMRLGVYFDRVMNENNAPFLVDFFA